MRALIGWLLVVSASSLAQGRVSAAPRSAVVRHGHTATKLEDGRVLVVGGRGADGLSTLGTCELFVPQKERWVPCAPLHTPRSQHVAVRLDDGSVLVVGGTTHHDDGSSRFVALASVERFDPKQNAWSVVAPMHEARSGHSAVRLNDGSVMVIGGLREQRVHLRSVERFDPQTGRWSPAPPLSHPRWQHDALTLDDGSVLVVGGRTLAEGKPGEAATDAVERWSVSTNQWDAMPALCEPRQRTAVVLNPGLPGADGGSAVMVIGGQTGSSSTNYAESWSPRTQEWVQFDNHLSLSLASHSGTVLRSGDVVVIGGEPPNAVDTARVQRWRADLQRWCLAGELTVSRKQHTATRLDDGRVLVVGGTSGGLPERSAELWSPTTGRCEEPPGISGGW